MKLRPADTSSRGAVNVGWANTVVFRASVTPTSRMKRCRGVMGATSVSVYCRMPVLHLCTAILAAERVRVVPLSCTRRTRLSTIFLVSHGVCEFNRHNAGWDCNDTVADDHDNRRGDLTQWCAWRKITVDHGGHSNYGPVDTSRNTRETICFAFNDVHERADDDNQEHYR